MLKYLDITINNRKIAAYMDTNIKPNHVKFIKRKYLIYVKKRAKKQKVTIKEIIQRDIETFDGSIVKRFNIFS